MVELLLRSTGCFHRPKFPQKITKITDYVYLGNLENAKNIHKSGIDFKYVVNLTTEEYKLPGGVTMIHVPLVDDIRTDISKYFNDVTSFLSRCEKRKEAVLVHCFAGINRSGSMIMAYLMTRKKSAVTSFNYFLYVYHELRKIRGAFIENPSFRKQIIDRYVID